jgi:hypothetical protein
MSVLGAKALRVCRKLCERYVRIAVQVVNAYLGFGAGRAPVDPKYQMTCRRS